MRRPCASQTRTADELDVHHVHTVSEPNRHRACTRLMWAMELVQMEAEAYFGI